MSVKIYMGKGVDVCSVKIYMGTGVDVCEDLHGDRGRCL